MKCENKHNGDMGKVHLWFNGWGIYGMGEAVMAKISFGSMLKCWSSRETTGFGIFQLTTFGLLQRGWEHSPPKTCFYLRSQALGWFSVL